MKVLMQPSQNTCFFRGALIKQFMVFTLTATLFACGGESDAPEIDLPLSAVEQPNSTPEVEPTTNPDSTPTQAPSTAVPIAMPTAIPTTVPTALPTMMPTAIPTTAPTAPPTMTPTAIPTAVPTALPTMTPTAIPTAVPTALPTMMPTAIPTAVPTALPTMTPTAIPTAVPTALPTMMPTAIPSAIPTAIPTIAPTAEPTSLPTSAPTGVDLVTGQSEYTTQCAGCHGASGEGVSPFPAIDATKLSFVHSSQPDTALNLEDYIDQYMGAALVASNCIIDADTNCAGAVASYIQNGFSVNASVAAVPEEERLERVTKGDTFYRDPTVNCVVCHGNDGSKTVGNGKSLENCDNCGSWTQLRDYIDGLMPQEPESGSSETGPFICTIENDCANRTADWIWNVVNNWTLTADGGERVETEDRYGQDTKRLKSYSMLKDDFMRIFGAVPANLAASATAFKASPDYWYDEPEMGAVALNVLANSAVQACATESLPALTTQALTESCEDWAARMWLRSATSDEIDSCVAVATEDTIGLSDEERALFTCVSMMISLPSITY